MTKLEALNTFIPKVCPELLKLDIYKEFLNIISKNNYNLYDELKLKTGQSKTTLQSKLLPLKTDSKNTEKWHSYIFRKAGYKYCSYCDSVKEVAEFSKNSSRSDGLNSSCKACQYTQNKEKQPARTAKYKAKNIQAVPSWANLQEISIFYSNCPTNYEVDHIVPLQSEVVCGLHVIENLQYLSKFDNISKNNTFSLE